MNKYSINLRFKNGSTTGFELEADDNLRDKVEKALESPNKTLQLGQYVFSSSEILWIKIEGQEATIKIEE